MKIDEVRTKIENFLKNTLKKSDVKVIRITKEDDGWSGDAEIYEESSFIKSIGLPTRVQDRNIYYIKLNDELDVNSYGLKEEESE
ncbi:MAG: hypothetical protein RAP70_01340 [Candidatus Celaenobacter antarcticus]|nr:hypothetical protein [Candidatus Celaenobacter antarcticus]